MLEGDNLTMTMDYHHDELQANDVAPVKDTPCPKCKLGILEDRVPRSYFVKKVLWFLPLKRYICYRCFRKSYIWYRQEK
jgi:hypothetical protein